jgi:hypothetical protein
LYIKEKEFLSKEKNKLIKLIENLKREIEELQVNPKTSI